MSPEFIGREITPRTVPVPGVAEVLNVIRDDEREPDVSDHFWGLSNSICVDPRENSMSTLVSRSRGQTPVD